MSVFRWRYDETCEGRYCCGDCDKCDKEDEPVDDLISRQAAIDAIWDGINMDIYTREVKEILEELPTAEKNDEEAFEEGYTKAQMELKDAYKPKKGKWVQDWRDERGYTHISGYKCTECDALYPWKTNYCPNCGARMEE